MSIFLTGSSGFVGKNLIKYFGGLYGIRCHQREQKIYIKEKIVIHCAGKAHDLGEASDFKDYYEVNTKLSEKVFDAFLNSNASVFIILSSVKAAADFLDGELTEDYSSDPGTHYGKSKFLAEEYIRSKIRVKNKRIYILRPCMIHGPGNKGNLNLLYQVVSKGLPWILGAFSNKRSFCSIENLLFIMKELIENEDIESGVYNVADDIPLSTNQVINLMGKSMRKKPKILAIPRPLIECISKLGDKLKLPLDSNRLKKLTQSYVVSNLKIVEAIGKDLPLSSEQGLLGTFESFKK